jgi:tetratricopeptide (TPR) repeat protein
VLAVLGLALPGSSYAGTPATALVEGLVLEREVATGQTDRYSVDLSAGHYLQVLVDQRGADVAATLIGPDGAVVLETDTISGLIGPDPVAFIASTTGAHELRLSVLDVLPRGSYEIRVEAVREPTALDRLRVEAVEAGVAALCVGAQDPAAAVTRFREAGSAWSRLGEPRLQMWMEYGTGTFLGEHLGRFEEARIVTEHGLAIALELGDDWAEALLRLQIGHCLRSLGRLEEGTDQVERALALHQAAERQAEAGRVLATLGTFASQAGDAQEALDRLFQALHSFETAGDTVYEALTRSLTAMAFLRLREPELALEQSRLALPALVEQPSVVPGLVAAERATCLATMGKANFELGDVARAREAFSEALAIWTTMGSPFGAVLTYAGLGDVHAADGNLAAAREAYASALARTGDDTTLQGIVQCRRGELELRLGDATAARSAFAAALAVAGRPGTLVAECAEAGLGRLARDDGDLGQRPAGMRSGRSPPASRCGPVCSATRPAPPCSPPSSPVRAAHRRPHAPARAGAHARKRRGRLRHQRAGPGAQPAGASGRGSGRRAPGRGAAAAGRRAFAPAAAQRHGARGSAGAGSGPGRPGERPARRRGDAADPARGNRGAHPTLEPAVRGAHPAPAADAGRGPHTGSRLRDAAPSVRAR